MAHFGVKTVIESGQHLYQQPSQWDETDPQQVWRTPRWGRLSRWYTGGQVCHLRERRWAGEMGQQESYRVPQGQTKSRGRMIPCTATGRLAGYPTALPERPWGSCWTTWTSGVELSSQVQVCVPGIFSLISVVILDDFSEVTTDLHQYSWDQKWAVLLLWWKVIWLITVF